ncbi:hypothetical protein [Gottfriedia acidiceleris]|uniref:hypothetical protein n=1 Tax=Gottfriedia acidiceleris TaxID=371036 RepID=UPI002FFF32EF
MFKKKYAIFTHDSIQLDQIIQLKYRYWYWQFFTLFADLVILIADSLNLIAESLILIAARHSFASFQWLFAQIGHLFAAL